MRRRDFLSTLSTGAMVGLVGCAGWDEKETVVEPAQPPVSGQPGPSPIFSPDSAVLAPSASSLPGTHEVLSNAEIQKRINKCRHFQETFDDDLFVEPKLIPVFKAVTRKLTDLRTHMGYAFFNLVSFDEAIQFAKRSGKMQPFSDAELSFLDQLFHQDARFYGFYGEKVTHELTGKVAERDTIKIAGTGHYVFRGAPHALYLKIRKELGDSIVLTSGIRSVVKQMHLFLSKATETQGNLSRASRSLAPPGHSFHGIGDFDVGKEGFGARNFSDSFARTSEYHKLIKSGYVRIRYYEDNILGVRYEPWHIKVATT